jgi:hypothetical protein
MLIHRKYFNSNLFPYHTVEQVPVTEAVTIHYTHYRDGAKVLRPVLANWYGRGPGKTLNLAPNSLTNSSLIEINNLGVELVACEHLMLVITGSMESEFVIGDTSVLYTFTPGEHNGDNGYGFMPTSTWKRITNNSHQTACAILNSNRAEDKIYKFSVISLDVDEEWIADQAFDFVHVVAGVGEIDQQECARYHTALHVESGTRLRASEPLMAIVGWTTPEPLDDSSPLS